jgi:hypothetical protein
MDFPATTLDTLPRSCVSGGELRVTSMVIPTNWSAMMDSCLATTRKVDRYTNTAVNRSQAEAKPDVVFEISRTGNLQW